MKLIWFVFSLSAFFSPCQAEIVEKVLAVINNEIITKSDLVDTRRKLNQQELVDELVLQIADPKQLLTDDAALLDHLINERVIDSEVKRLNLSSTIERVEQEIRTITGREKISRNQLKEALGARGVDFSDYQDFIRTSLERQTLFEREITSKIKVTEEEISEYYLKNSKDKQAQVYEYKIAHILFLPERGGDEEAKQRAAAALSKLNENKVSFEKLASQVSEAPGFIAGGILGEFKAGEMAKEIETSITPLSVGQLSGVVRTKQGYHILKLLKKSFVPNPDFEAKKPEITRKLMMMSFERGLKSWLKEKRSQAFLRINEIKS